MSAANDIGATCAPKRCADGAPGERATARPVRESPQARRVRLLGEVDALLNEFTRPCPKLSPFELVRSTRAALRSPL